MLYCKLFLILVIETFKYVKYVQSLNRYISQFVVLYLLMKFKFLEEF